MQMAMGCPNTAVAAVCDVYEPRRSQAVTLTDGKATPYIDYRELLDREDIDGVIIATPDHWHQRVLTDTVQAGKDAYCEKPMSKTLEQGFEMIKAVRNTDAVVQIGTHRRAGQQYREARKLVEEGKLGTIRFARGYDCRNYTILDPFAPPKEFTGELDWDRFEGPAGHHEFRPERYTAWRWFWDYAGGLVTDVGVHVMDVIHWVTGADTPKSVVCHGSAYQLGYWRRRMLWTPCSTTARTP
jgi:predicted dehydrogenase